MIDGFRFVLASQLDDPDGMLLELREDGTLDILAEVFEDDATGALTFTAHRPGIPLEAIEELLVRARKEFPSPHLRQGQEE